MARDIAVTSEHLKDGRLRFHVNAPVHTMAPGAYRFADALAAAGVPVAEAVLAVPGVDAVVLSDDAVTVEKALGNEWCDLEEQLQYAVTAGVSGMKQPSTSDADMDDDALYEVVSEIFQREINPSIASHGGAVELIDVQDRTVVLRMQGGCQGCGMANVTLRQGIEGTLRRILPSLKGVQDVTDHSAGSDPYFASAKT
jgi:Fe-S cluster biogenesis protein NfuA